MYIKFTGNLFLQMLKGIIIPLVIPSLIVAVGSLDIGLSGKESTLNYITQIWPKNYPSLSPVIASSHKHNKMISWANIWQDRLTTSWNH